MYPSRTRRALSVLETDNERSSASSPLRERRHVAQARAGRDAAAGWPGRSTRAPGAPRHGPNLRPPSHHPATASTHRARAARS